MNYETASCIDDDIDEGTYTRCSSEYMTDEEKASVLEVIDRLSRILNWEPSNRKDLLSRERGCTILRDVLLHVERWKTFRANNINQQRLIIYKLAKLCFCYWVKDSSIVVGVLRQVYAYHGNFCSMYSHVVNQHVVSDGRVLPHSLDSREQEYKAMKYFLYHAHKAKLTIGGIRFVDRQLRSPLHRESHLIRRSPKLSILIVYTKPKILQHLLQYGANIAFSICNTDDWNNQATESTLLSSRRLQSSFLSMYLKHMVTVLWAAFDSDRSWMTSEDSESSVMRSRMNDIQQNLALFLRVIPQIKLGQLNISLMSVDQGGFLRRSSTRSHDFIRWISAEGIVPKLSARYLQPSELRHLCRCVIRKSLNRNGNLPYGTLSLPLPKSLMQYINLSRD